jgi:3-dehydroquinate synthase
MEISQFAGLLDDPEELSRTLNRLGFHAFHFIVDGRFLAAHPRVATSLDWIASTAQGSSVLVLRGGERCKSMATLDHVISHLDHAGARRSRQAAVAIGGGAVLDTASLAATLYRRGMPFVRVPTTLLATIDAAIGAKSAVNFHGRKNLVGSYKLPAAVLIDTTVLSTLSARHTRSGLAEAIKLGLAADPELLEMVRASAPDVIASRGQSPASARLIERAIASMIEQLAGDVWEARLLHKTDLGHSFSRYFEQVLRPRPTHGEAVSLDLSLTARCSESLGLLSRAERVDLEGVLQIAGLPVSWKGLTVEIVTHALEDAVTHRDGNLFPMPSSSGHLEMVALDQDTVVASTTL